MAELIARVEDGFANGDSMAEVLKANNLSETVTPPLTTGGQAPDHADFQLPPALQPVVKAAFTTGRSDEHTSELQSLMRISYAVFCLNKKTTNTRQQYYERTKI